MPELWDQLAQQGVEPPSLWPNGDRAPLRITVGGPTSKDGEQAPGYSLDPFNPPPVEYVGKPLAKALAYTLEHINNLGRGFVGASQQYSGEQFPEQAKARTGEYPTLSTDFEPVMQAVNMMDPLIANLWGVGSAAVPAGALGAAGSKADLVWSSLSKTKHVPEEMMSAKITPTNDLLPAKNIQPADLQGGVAVALPGDRTAAGGLLTDINGNWFSRAVPLEGGFNYMRSPAQQIDNAMWASTPGATSTLSGRVKDLAESGKDIFGVYSSMAPHSGDFSTMMSDALLSQLHVSDISKAGVAAFDKAMRSEYKNWPGLNHINLRETLNANGPMRKAFVKVAALGEHQAAGLPDIASARRAITEPELLHQPTGMSGHAIGKFDPTGRIIERPSVEHGTYSAPTAGTYEGRFEVPVPRDMLWRDWFASRAKAGESTNVNDPTNQYAFGRQLVAQNMDQQAVDTLSKYIEARKAGTALFANAGDRKTGAAVLSGTLAPALFGEQRQ